MFPVVWGSRAWDLMFLVAMNYSETPNKENQTSMLQFFESLMKVLPCFACSQHAFEYISKNPPNVSSRMGLVEWVVTFHNHVNERLKKPTMTVPEATQSLILRCGTELAQKSGKAVKTIVGEVQPPQQANATTDNSSETLYFWLMIVLAVVAGVFLIAFLITLFQKKRMQKKMNAL